MKVMIQIDASLAETAVGQHLIYNEDDPITNKRKFRDVVRHYVTTYGTHNQDDHDWEIMSHGIKSLARAYVNLYM